MVPGPIPPWPVCIRLSDPLWSSSSSLDPMFSFNVPRLLPHPLRLRPLALLLPSTHCLTLQCLFSEPSHSGSRLSYQSRSTLVSLSYNEPPPSSVAGPLRVLDTWFQTRNPAVDCLAQPYQAEALLNPGSTPLTFTEMRANGPSPFTPNSSL